MDDAAVVKLLALLFVADVKSGGRRSLSGYQELFPGFEDVVATHLVLLSETEDGKGKDGQRRPDRTRTADEGMEIGPYRITKELGRGGQAVVYLAEDGRLHRKVALKVMTGLGPGTDNLLERFRREAAVASKADHPGLCPIYDTGVEGGVAYIAMRFVEGTTLAQRIRSMREVSGRASSNFTLTESDGQGIHRPHGDLEPSTMMTPGRDEVRNIIQMIEQSARALHAAHEAGVIHRDIKPGNIMVTPSGETVVLDFGLARDLDSDNPTLTRTGDLFGTPHYMSPEQITRQSVRLDRRTDVYSLGVALFECLTLQRPFDAPTREALYQAILAKDPSDARRLNPRVSKDLKIVLETALEKDRDRRYQTALDFAEDLRRVLGQEPIAARPAGPILKLRRWVGRKPAIAGSVFTTFVVLAGALVVLLHFFAESESQRQHLERVIAEAESAREGMNLAVATSDQLQSDLETERSKRQEVQTALETLKKTLDEKSRADEIALRTLREAAENASEPPAGPADTGIRSEIQGDIAGAKGIHDRYARGVGFIAVGTSFYSPRQKAFLRYEIDPDTGKRLSDDALSFGGKGDKFVEWCMGSGFVVSKDGLLLSSRHVMDPWFEDDEFGQAFVNIGCRFFRERFVAFFPGRTEPIDLVRVAAHPDADLALARLICPDAELPLLDLEPDGRPPRVGQKTILLGYPMGFQGLLAKLDGSVARELLKAGIPEFEPAIRTIARLGGIRGTMTQGVLSAVTPTRLIYEADATSGGSGGPLFSSDGVVIGVNMASAPIPGASAAVPIEAAKAMLRSGTLTERTFDEIEMRPEAIDVNAQDPPGGGTGRPR